MRPGEKGCAVAMQQLKAAAASIQKPAQQKANKPAAVLCFSLPLTHMQGVLRLETTAPCREAIISSMLALHAAQM